MKHGVIESIDPRRECKLGRTYYMPHHAVLREDKETTKTRIVYDASSKMFWNLLNETKFTSLVGTFKI